MVEFGKTDFDTLVNTFFLRSKYEPALRASAPLSVEGKVDSQFVIIMRHDWGPKGSVLLRGYFDNLVRNELRTQPTIDVTDEAVTISFHMIPRPRL